MNSLKNLEAPAKSHSFLTRSLSMDPIKIPLHENERLENLKKRMQIETLQFGGITESEHESSEEEEGTPGFADK